MTVLVAGASGATGRLLVGQLLELGASVRIIVRTQSNLPEIFTNHKNLTQIHASILELNDAEIVQYVKGCDAVASCLGHNMSLKGLFGSPRKLVTDATRRLCNAVMENESEKPTRFVLMNTAGNSNRDLQESVSFGQRCVTGLIRLLLPPHADNEKAADFLRCTIGRNHPYIEWVAVRPDTLIDAAAVSEYDEVPSPNRSAVFDPGCTSRINVAHFMARLITEDAIWNKWRSQMPVLYNKEPAV